MTEFNPALPFTQVDVPPQDDVMGIMTPTQTILNADNAQTVELPQDLTERETDFLLLSDGASDATWLGTYKEVQNWARGFSSFFLSLPEVPATFTKEFAERRLEELKQPLNFGDLLDSLDIFMNSGARTGAQEKLFAFVTGQELDFDVVKAQSDRLTGAADEFIKANRFKLQQMGLTNPEGSLAFDVGSGFGSMGSAVLMTMLTRTPAYSAAFFAALQQTHIYQEAREKGFTPEDASVLSNLAGIMEGGIEAVGGGIFLRLAAVDKPMLRLIARVIEETVQETTQQLSEEVITQVAELRPVDIQGGIGRVAYAALIGTIVSGPVATVTQLVENTAREEGVTPELAQAILGTMQEMKPEIDEQMVQILEALNSDVATDPKAQKEVTEIIRKFTSGEDIDIGTDPGVAAALINILSQVEEIKGLEQEEIKGLEQEVEAGRVRELDRQIQTLDIQISTLELEFDAKTLAKKPTKKVQNKIDKLSAERAELEREQADITFPPTVEAEKREAAELEEEGRPIEEEIRQDDRVVARVNTTVSTDRMNIHINSVESLEAGGGTIAMQQLIERADAEGQSLSLFAEPFGAEALNKDALIEFYQNFGFVFDGDFGTRAARQIVPDIEAEVDARAEGGPEMTRRNFMQGLTALVGTTVIKPSAALSTILKQTASAVGGKLRIADWVSIWHFKVYEQEDDFSALLDAHPLVQALSKQGINVKGSIDDHDPHIEFTVGGVTISDFDLIQFDEGDPDNFLDEDDVKAIKSLTKNQRKALDQLIDDTQDANNVLGDRDGHADDNESFKEDRDRIRTVLKFIEEDLSHEQISQLGEVIEKAIPGIMKQSGIIRDANGTLIIDGPDDLLALISEFIDKKPDQAIKALEDLVGQEVPQPQEALFNTAKIVEQLVNDLQMEKTIDKFPTRSKLILPDGRILIPSESGDFHITEAIKSLGLKRVQRNTQAFEDLKNQMRLVDVGHNTIDLPDQLTQIQRDLVEELIPHFKGDLELGLLKDHRNVERVEFFDDTDGDPVKFLDEHTTTVKQIEQPVEVINLDEVREEQRLQGFHQKLMEDIRERTIEAIEKGEAHEWSVEVGDKILTAQGAREGTAPWTITSRLIRKKGLHPDSDLTPGGERIEGEDIPYIVVERGEEKTQLPEWAVTVVFRKEGPVLQEVKPEIPKFNEETEQSLWDLLTETIGVKGLKLGTGDISPFMFFDGTIKFDGRLGHASAAQQLGIPGPVEEVGGRVAEEIVVNLMLATGVVRIRENAFSYVKGTLTAQQVKKLMQLARAQSQALLKEFGPGLGATPFIDRFDQAGNLIDSVEGLNNVLSALNEELDPDAGIDVEQRNEAFDTLADAQRGAPEVAMTNAQSKLGGGVLSFVLEHVGDITHRMSEKFSFLEGSSDTVADKVRRSLSSLRQEFGFAKEHKGNMRSNADHRGVTLDEHMKGVKAALKKYATAHRKLKVFNEPQRWARDAAIALGEGNWAKATKLLEKLEELLKDPIAYREAVGQFTPPPPKKKEHKLLTIRESTLKKLGDIAIKEKIQALRKGFRTGLSIGKKDTKAAQEFVIKLLKDSGLEAKDRDKFSRTIKNLNSIEKLKQRLPGIQSRVIKLLETARRNKIQTQLTDLVKGTKAKGGKQLKGDFDPEAQDILDTARNTLALSVSTAQERLTAALADETPTSEAALQNGLLAIAARSEDLTIDDMERILIELAEIKAEGRAAGKQRLAVKQSKAALRTQSVSEAVTQSEDIDSIDSTELAKRFQAAIRLGRDVSGTLWDNWNDILDIIINKRGVDGAASIIKALSTTEDTQNRKALQRSLGTKMTELGLQAFGFKTQKQLMKKFMRDSITKSLGPFQDLNGRKIALRYSVAEARKLYMESVDPSISDTITHENGNAYTDEMVEAIFNLLEPEDIAYAHAQIKFYKELYDQVNEVYKRVYGVNLPFNEFYSPITRDRGAKPLFTIFSKKDENNILQDNFLKEINFRRTLTATALKNRTKNLIPLAKRNDAAVMQRHIHDMSHFITMVEKAQLLNSVFGNPRLRKEIRARHSDIMMLHIDSYLEDINRGYLKRGAVFETMFNYFNRNFARSVLALKPQIGIKQFSSLWAMGENIPTKDFYVGMVDFLKNPVKNYKTMLKESALLPDRGGSQDIEISKLAASDKALAQFVRSQSLDNFLSVFIRLGDRTPIYLGGWAVRHHAMKSKSQGGLGLTKKQAIAKYEKATADTQQSTDLDQLSALQRSGALGRAISMFMSAPLALVRGEIRAIRQFSRGKITPREFGKRMAIYHLIIPQVFTIIASGFRWEPDKQAVAAAIGSFNGLVIYADLIKNVLFALIGSKQIRFNNDIPIYDVLDDVFNGVADAATATSAEEFFEGVKELSIGVGKAKGLPVKQAFDFADGIKAMSEGETEVGTLLLLGWPPSVAEK